MADGHTSWRRCTGTYVVPAGQTVTRFAFESVATAGNNPEGGNLLDGVTLRDADLPGHALNAVKAGARRTG